MPTTTVSTTTTQYELWLSAPGDHEEALNDFGLFDSRLVSQRMARAVMDWFHDGQWSPMLDTLPKAAQTDLWKTRQRVKRTGQLDRLRVRSQRVRPTVCAAGMTAVAVHVPGEDEDTVLYVRP